MPVRKKRSISMPPDLDTMIEETSGREGTTYSGWLAGVARKELAIRAGLAGVAEFESEHGAFTAEELAEARRWASGIPASPQRKRMGPRRTA